MHFQVEEETLATIERDNRILLEKMSFVMRTRGRVDNRNDYEHKSLNKTKRQRELLRVTHENQVRNKLAIKMTVIMTATGPGHPKTRGHTSIGKTATSSYRCSIAS